MNLLKRKKKKKKKNNIQKIKKENKLLTKLKKINFNNIFGGMAVGIANIIPGVSGGTMLVIFNLFDKIMYSISDIFKRKTDTRKQSIIFLLQVFIGAAIGVVGFAKLLGITLEYLEAETIFWFMGLILFSVPIVVKSELKGNKFSIVSFIFGFAIIGILQYLQMKNPSNSVEGSTDIISLLFLILYGMIAGATMIFPGISGSMVLLVLGKYELIRSYIDKITTFDTKIILSLGFFGIGAILGVILSAKLTTYLLNNYKGKTISVILGFIIASALILPFNITSTVSLDTPNLCAIIASFILGGVIIYYINRLQEKKNS